MTYLDFEKPIAELESQIRDMKNLESGDELNISEEVTRLETKLDKLLRETYSRLSPWQKIKVARHPNRPHFPDYISAMVTDFMPLAGDRNFADDAAITGGLGRFKGQSVMVIGHEKGDDTQSRIKHNFGMARPEGYRKTIRLFKMAEQFDIPVITLVDTPGAYPGIGAEERGQAEAIARSTEACLSLRVPLVSVIVGEGGSGGAVALAAGNRILMMEHAVYSVISPEGCASILWRTADKAEEAATALKITAQDLLKLKVIDEIIPEPVGGAHRDHDKTMESLSKGIDQALTDLSALSADKLKELRREKFLNMGNVGL
ncbi:acetyl-CoA carboxylase carboxyltransferase subunit alpha [Emcibacter sp.]|uniref:acetyl-CoA carboxylase carboxyltransferase subunit alpha n=1 Tax=Emcibacter sp. TaxID=1979954 RepID=UPI003A959587